MHYSVALLSGEPQRQIALVVVRSPDRSAPPAIKWRDRVFVRAERQRDQLHHGDTYIETDCAHVHSTIIETEA